MRVIARFDKPALWEKQQTIHSVALLAFAKGQTNHFQQFFKAQRLNIMLHFEGFQWKKLRRVAVAANQ
jgi:transposase